jgi:transposase
MGARPGGSGAFARLSRQAAAADEQRILGFARLRNAQEDDGRPLRGAPRLAAQAARVSRKFDLGEAMAYMLRRQDGFQLFLADGRIDIDSNLVKNAIRSPAMNRCNALFASLDEGGSRLRYTEALSTPITEVAW